MKTSIKGILIFFFLAVSGIAIPQETKWDDIPMTTTSKEAMKCYIDGVKALNDVDINKSNDLFIKASELDPNFIMPNQLLAFSYLYYKEMDQFKKYANKALASTYKLTESEMLLQKALKKLLEDPTANVTEFGEKLVQLNPKTYAAYQWLSSYQQFAKDYEGLDKTLHAQLKLTKFPGPIYNVMGYNYMALNKMDKAKEAFENYIKAEPKNPNSYDSMGDYFDKKEDYKNAYTNFMKAYEMDSVRFKISHDKAMNIKPKLGK
jgi:Tfp pilus assembly protein PilF